MLVTCKICKAKIDKETAYKVIVKDKNLYFCSEKEYVDDKQKKEKAKVDKDAVYNEIIKIFGYRVQNSQLFKEWTVWNTLKSDSIIAQYLHENEDYLTQAISRLPDIEFNRIRYFATILKNNLHDFSPKEEPKMQASYISIDEGYQTKYTPKKKATSLEDLEDEVAE